jgi:hypothetical protein
MLAILQFPLGDSRAFLPNASARLAVPEWPSPRTFDRPQFIRQFGQARDRRDLGDPAWPDEVAFCNAHRAIRFPDLRRRRTGPPLNITLGCVFRRLASDGSAVARLEVGFRPGNKTRVLGADVSALRSLAESILTLPSVVAGEPPRALREQAPALAKTYAAATTSRKQPVADPSRLVRYGVPILVIQVDPGEKGPWPDASRVDGARVKGCELAFDKRNGMPVWLLSRGTADDAYMRRLRICILRLHAEQVALDLVLKEIDSGGVPFEKGTPHTNKLEDYLFRATRALDGKDWAGVSQSAVLDAFKAFAAYKAEPLDSLSDRLSGVRRQTLLKLQNYLIQRGGNTVNVVGRDQITITAGRDVINPVIAQRIDGSFQNFKDANPSQDLETSMKELHEAMKTLLAAPPPGVDAEKVATKLETFTEQVAKPKPDEEVLQVTAKGLLAAAQNVAAVAAPVAMAVKTILGILGVALI